MSKLTQRDRLLRHLRDYGSITRLEALAEYGIANPTARIAELRQKGYPIRTEWIYGKNRYNEPTKWGKWILERAA